MRVYGTALATIDGKVRYSVGIFDGESHGIVLSYTSFMRVVATHSGIDGTLDGESLKYVGFGNFAPPDQLPRSGSAAYARRLPGDLHDDTKSLAAPIVGLISRSILLQGRWLPACFRSGSVPTARLQPWAGMTSTAPSMPAHPRSSGKSNAEAGDIAGRFYGDRAQEYAAVFNIADPAVGKMTGVTVGAQEAP